MLVVSTTGLPGNDVCTIAETQPVRESSCQSTANPLGSNASVMPDWELAFGDLKAANVQSGLVFRNTGSCVLCCVRVQPPFCVLL